MKTTTRSQRKSSLALSLALAIGALALEGCTVYSGCADLYGSERSLGVYLAEACSRGVTFARKFGETGAAMQCRSNYFHADAIEACEEGYRLQKGGNEGDVLRRGLDF